MATKFLFRLNRLLDLRRRQADDARRALAEAMAQVQTALEIQVRIKDEQHLLNEAWREAASRLKPDQALDFQRSMASLSQADELNRQNLLELRKKEADCRARQEKILIKVRALEKMHDRQLKRFTQENNKQEQAGLDEFAVVRPRQETR